MLLTFILFSFYVAAPETSETHESRSKTKQPTIIKHTLIEKDHLGDWSPKKG